MATGTIKVKESVFEWVGKDRQGRIVQGELRAAGEATAQNTLRRQGIFGYQKKKRKMSSGKKIKPKEYATVYPSNGHHDEGRCPLTPVV